MSLDLRARTLLDLAAPRIAQAKIHTRGFRLIQGALGERVARWAYADRGAELGHRDRSQAEAELRGWDPSVDDWCLVLYGPTGIGKTISAARYVAERGGLLLKATDADTWGFSGGEGLLTAKAAEWLLIDDLGDEKTALGSANLATLISDRAATGRRLVCTTTVSPAELLAKGDHIASRLRPYFVALTDSTDRRSKTPPFMRGITRQFELMRLAELVDDVGRGYPDGPEGEAAVHDLGKIVGVDIGTPGFAARVQARGAEETQVSAMLAAVMGGLK